MTVGWFRSGRWKRRAITEPAELSWSQLVDVKLHLGCPGTGLSLVIPGLVQSTMFKTV